MPTRRVQPTRTVPSPLWKQPIAIAAAGLVLVIAVWLLWPSSSANVANLDSAGTSIIAFGDSLTAGYGARPGEDYPSRLALLIGSPVVNAGVSGDTTASALERVERDVLARAPRIVIVGLGGNDYLQSVPIESTERTLRAIVGKLRSSGAIVVLLGFRFPSLNADYAAMYERVAEEEQCLLVDGVLRGILTDNALKSDAIHPNARGYQLMAERIAEPLAELIADADRRRR